jgi:hypothetical protein
VGQLGVVGNLKLQIMKDFHEVSMQPQFAKARKEAFSLTLNNIHYTVTQGKIPSNTSP